jgi:hypothetical protein
VAAPAAEEDIIHGQLPRDRLGVADASSREAQPFRSGIRLRFARRSSLPSVSSRWQSGATSSRLDGGRKPVEAVCSACAASTPSTRSSIFSSVPRGWVTSVAVGPKPGGGLVHRRQVMEVNDVASARGTGDDQRLP